MLLGCKGRLLRDGCGDGATDVRTTEARVDSDGAGVASVSMVVDEMG